ncbi:MAG: hypothetical protein S4CHLAM37_09730 [Chlamydiia bacterium]|nr:hypothetical protein [Chlamydiia bacterium]
MNVAIILLNFNGKKDTLECLSSLKNLTYRKHHVIVVDNGSSDDSALEIKKHYPDVTLIENEENLGFAEGNNVAIRYALEKGFDGIFLLNNDTAVEPDILDELVKGSKKHPKALLGAKIYLYSQRDTYDHLGGMWNEKKASFDLIAAREVDDHKTYEDFFPVDYICGCALFAKSEVFKKVGLLDARFFLFWEESDFCTRAKEYGYKNLICPKAKVYHKVSASFTGGRPHTTYFWWRNRLLWLEKNVPSIRRKAIYKNTVTKEITKLYKHKFLKTLQCTLLMLVKPSSYKKRKNKLLEYKAATAGICDYTKRRFYNAPSWVFKKRS